MGDVGRSDGRRARGVGACAVAVRTAGAFETETGEEGARSPNAQTRAKWATSNSLNSEPSLPSQRKRPPFVMVLLFFLSGSHGVAATSWVGIATFGTAPNSCHAPAQRGSFLFL